jgi:hypothetical protein
MNRLKRRLNLSAVLCLGLGIMVGPGRGLGSSHKADDNGLTSRLYQLLDKLPNSKLDDLYILADTYTDPSGDQDRHVLRVDYDKSRAFGRLAIYVRSVGKMTPEQLATYTPQQIYDFGESDLMKFVKTDPGPFGERGDMYLESSESEPLHTTNITEAARKSYEFFVSQYIIPALEKGQ